MRGVGNLAARIPTFPSADVRFNVPRRLAEVRTLGNSQRETVTSNNPHMMKRRVAAQLDEVAASAQHLPLAVTLAHAP